MIQQFAGYAVLGLLLLICIMSWWVMHPSEKRAVVVETCMNAITISDYVDLPQGNYIVVPGDGEQALVFRISSPINTSRSFTVKSSTLPHDKDGQLFHSFSKQ